MSSSLGLVKAASVGLESFRQKGQLEMHRSALDTVLDQI